jgi:hypothetical protein
LAAKKEKEIGNTQADKNHFPGSIYVEREDNKWSLDKPIV